MLLYSNTQIIWHFNVTEYCCYPPCHSLLWRHDERDSVSNHLRLGCLLNRSFRRRSKKTPRLRVTGLCEGNPPVDSAHKGPVTRKIFPFDDVITNYKLYQQAGVQLMHGMPHVIVGKVACAIDVAGRMLIKLTSTCQVLRTHIHMEITCIWVYLTTESEWFPCVLWVCTLNTENRYDANLVVNGGTGGFYDNQRCHQWRQSWHHDDTRFSVYVSKMKCTFIIIHCTLFIILIILYVNNLYIL